MLIYNLLDNICKHRFADLQYKLLHQPNSHNNRIPQLAHVGFCNNPLHLFQV